MILPLLSAVFVYGVAWTIRFGFWEVARKIYWRTAKLRDSHAQKNFIKTYAVDPPINAFGTSSVTPGGPEDIKSAETAPTRKPIGAKGADALWLAGNIVYWVGVTVAVFFALLGVAAVIDDHVPIALFWFLPVFAALFYALGLGFRYAFRSIALKRYRRAAERGNLHAQHKLFSIYKEGKLLGTDSTEMLGWLRTTAEQGIANAQYYLGRRYETGLGVPQDFANAIEWYERAAKQGDARAQKSLATLFAEGQKLTRDNATAVDWHRYFTEQNEINRVVLLWVFIPTLVIVILLSVLIMFGGPFYAPGF